jgi:outer membrane protein, multidrug efflux system
MRPKRYFPIVLALVLAPLPVRAQEAPAPEPEVLPAPATPRPEGTLTLEEAQRIALERSPTVQSIALELDRSDALIREAWAAMLPSLGANLQYVMADQPTVVSFDMGSASDLFGGAQDIVVRQQHVATLGLSARQSILRAQSIQGIRTAYAARDLSQVSIDQARRQMLFAVAQAFYASLSARRTLELIERSIALAQENVAAARARLDAQVGLAHDVARAELEVERLNSQRQSTLLGHDNARDALALLMGVEPSELPELAEPSPPPIDPGQSIDDFVARAEAERLDLRASHRQVRLAQLNLGSVWAGFIPTLDLSWSLSHTLTDLGGFGDRRTSWNLALVLSIPLFDGGFRYGQLRDSRARLRQAQLAQESLEQSVSIQVRQAFRAWRTSLETLAISRRTLDLARETYRLVHASYTAGAATSLDVVDAQRALAAAEVDVELQRLNSQLAMLQLLSRLEVGPQSAASSMGSSSSSSSMGASSMGGEY